MENRYQKFLRQTLRVGLEELRDNPSATEVIGIPRQTFEILVRAFRSGLPPDLLANLPEHNLTNRDYLEALVGRIDFLLSPGRIGEPEETTISNVPPLANLLPAYERAKELKDNLEKQRTDWREKFDEQVEKYNRELVARLTVQLTKEFPELTPEKAAVVAGHVIDKVSESLPELETAEEVTTVLSQGVEEVLKTDFRLDPDLTKLVEANDPRISSIPREVSGREKGKVWSLRETQIKSERVPAYYFVESQIGAVVQTNLSPDLASDEALINEISRRVLSRLSLPALAALSPEEFKSEYRNEVSTILKSSEFRAITKEYQDRLTSALAEQTRETAITYSKSPEATMAGVAAPAPPPPPGGPPPPFTGPRDKLGDIFFSSGSPGHILTSLASPQAGENLAKWAITGGLLRAPLGFALESVPGTPKLNYILDLFGPYFEGIKGGFIKELAEAQKLPLGYERERLEQEATTHLAIISQFEKEIEKKPWLKLAYQGRVGLYRILHPIRYLQLRLMQRSLALGIGVQSLSDIISAYVKYGGYGGAYITEAVLKNLAVYALKVVGVKIGLYEVVGVYPYQKYIFKPTHRLKLKAQQFVYEKAFKGLAKKLGQSALGKFISFIVSSFLTGGGRVVFELLRRFWKWLVGGLGIFLLWLITQLGTIAGIITFGIGAVGGAIIGWAIGGPVGAAIGFFVGPIITGLIATFLKNLLFPEGAVVGAGGLGAGGIGAVPSLTPYAAPTLLLAGATVLPAAIFTLMVISESFVVPGEEIGYGSRFIQISKGYSVASFQNEDRLPNSVAENSETITYQVKVDVSQPTQPLTDIVVTDKLVVTNAAGSQSFDLGTWDKKTDPQLAQMGAGDSWEKTYTFGLNPGFIDSVFSNTVTVKSAEGETQTGTLSFIIGNPPVETPLGWPVASGCITQGPGGYYSHRGYEAIDIGSSEVPILGDPVFATHNGTITRVVDDQDTATSGYGNHVIITGVGPNGPFETLYAHLQIVSVLYGDKVNRGDQIGTVGDTGKSDGPHLHYEFRNLKMEPDYIPRSVPACSGSGPVSCQEALREQRCW